MVPGANVQKLLREEYKSNPNIREYYEAKWKFEMKQMQKQRELFRKYGNKPSLLKQKLKELQANEEHFIHPAWTHWMHDPQYAHLQ